ncbi:MAG: hypothetical protein KC519_02990 [Anaerolineae bacterium]|nr:hypothetical protein [Anaerolineae bacterium]
MSARLVRAAIDLTDQIVIQTDVPHSTAALSELNLNPYQLVVCAVRLYEDEVDGYAFVQQIMPHLPDTAIVLIGEDGDSDAEFDGNAVMMRRPLDPQQFFRVFQYALQGRDVRSALNGQSPAQAALLDDAGHIPVLDLAAVSKIIDVLLRDIAPLSLVLATRAGEVLLQRGTDKRLDGEQLAQAVLPATQSTIQVGHLTRGKGSSLSFYDGDHYDIFVLSIGYHHVLCLVFDGKGGSKLFGAVRSYAQRAAQDIIALMGEGAYNLNHTGVKKKNMRQSQVMDVVQEIEQAALLRAEHIDDQLETAEVEAPAPQRLQLEPLDNFDPALLDQLDGMDSSDADALFDLDALAEIAKGPDHNGGELTYEEAQRLGIVQ